MGSGHLLLAAAVTMLFVMASEQLVDNIFQPTGNLLCTQSCSTTDNYTDSSQYKKNLDSLLAALPAAAGDNGWFYRSSAETGADEVFGLIMCFADRSAKECSDCLTGAPARIRTVCPGSRNVSTAYEACVLRYSAAPIPATVDLDAALVVGVPGTPVTSDAVLKAWVPLMSSLSRVLHSLAADVALSPLLIANDTTPYSSTQEMYGLAQCTRDLNPTECTRCVKIYIAQVESTFPNYTGGCIKGSSCNLVSQVGFPIDITLPPMPALPAPPPPAAASLIVLASLIWIHGRLRRRRIPAKILKEKRGQELQERSFFDDNEPEMEDEFEKGTGPKRFRYGELAVATDNFSDQQKLGEGGFGSVYRGYLKEMDLHVAIKRVSKGSKQGRKEYASEVRIISRLRHRNLVQLIGWSHGSGDDELLLVYELMPNGSLDGHLHSPDSVLTWPVRYRVALGVGAALLYLHEDAAEQRVVHRDVKPSNVMLDASFNAKLGDFGLARLIGDGRRSHTTGVAGTFGYMDPKCVLAGKASVESDVYSFGVLLLEGSPGLVRHACGRRPAVLVGEEEDGHLVHVHLVQWVWDSYGGGSILDAADTRLGGEFDGREMACAMIVGLWCAHPDRSRRPNIRQAFNALRCEAPPPRLPAKMPVATDGFPPAGSSSTTSSTEAGRTTSQGLGGGGVQTPTTAASLDIEHSSSVQHEDDSTLM
ncbi:hypothetical protein PVAP13_3NG279205 [Panicum virgatum]|uniref:Uncharacterized protein n=1 Tax=Panicum virgatum TaxID=38727 RepID=A0A8T0UC08_PANVG|nr:hypothetical protein PVAP13_3NG279205 [Panicum virgatum]